MKPLIFAGVFFCSVGFGLSAPSFQGELLGGGKANLAEKLKPGRAVLLCFWATWCAPCLEELKTVAEKLKANPALPLDVLTINVDTSETVSDVKPTVNLYGISFPVILDTKHDVFGKYKADKTLPYSVLIDSKGDIQSTFSGYQENMITKIKEIVSETAKKKG